MSTFTTLLMAATTVLALTPAVHAGDLYPEPAGGCPKGHRLILRAETGAPRSRWCDPPKAERSEASSADSGSGATYVEPIVYSVPKASPYSWCPTGYYTRDALCATPWENAPRTRRKAGACPSGTVEEFGAYCTDVIADLSNAMLDQLDAAATRDFNVVYTEAMVAGVESPAQEHGAAFKDALARREAAGDPWQDARDRASAQSQAADAERQRQDREAQAAQASHTHEQYRVMCEAARPNFPNGYPPGHTCEPFNTSPGKAPTEAAGTIKQEAGKALRGLFGDG